MASSLPLSRRSQIETIVADGTTLDFLRDDGTPPLRLQFPSLQVHNVREGRPLSFFARALITKPQGIRPRQWFIGSIPHK